MGGVVLVVGASGAGKDTLLRLARKRLARDPRFLFPRRVVTRPSSAVEDHDTLDDVAFDEAERAGRFALSWRAHGLAYGIPAAAIEAAQRDQVVICNVSRMSLRAARETMPNVAVVEVTAPPEILAFRLAQRGRSEDRDLSERLKRSDEVGEVAPDLRIENVGSPDRAAAELVRFLEGRAALSGASSYA